MNLRPDLAQAQQHTVQNQTTTMLALGANLMNQTTAQTHKLTAVEAQVREEHQKARLVLQASCLCHFPGEVWAFSGPKPSGLPSYIHITSHLPALLGLTPLC